MRPSSSLSYLRAVGGGRRVLRRRSRPIPRRFHCASTRASAYANQVGIPFITIAFPSTLPERRFGVCLLACFPVCWSARCHEPLGPQAPTAYSQVARPRAARPACRRRPGVGPLRDAGETIKQLPYPQIRKRAPAWSLLGTIREAPAPTPPRLPLRPAPRESRSPRRG